MKVLTITHLETGIEFPSFIGLAYILRLPTLSTYKTMRLIQ